MHKHSLHGLLLVDKPEGITSNDVVRTVKRLVKPSKVGHSGTLDPAASGLIVILIGAGTRTLEYLDETPKWYSLTVRLGEQTDTDDRDGTIIRTADPSTITLGEIEEVLQNYRGVIDQVPPHFSAIKKSGVPLYKLAHKGTLVTPEPRKVEVFLLEVRRWEQPFLDLDLICSKGTYARSLARDIGRDLAVGGRLERLRRTAAGVFKIENASPLEEISAGGSAAIAEKLISLARALSHIPDLPITPPELRTLTRGGAVIIPKSRLPRPEVSTVQQTQLFKIVSGNGGLVILVRPQPKRSEILIRPTRVFNTLKNG
ncbi:MAG: tRNA pseudouridine(55) synthase TruB [Deltaproteobacteria bacterium]|nr:tRNA pseudouridine(55) synthase TruB [Deltaproteobacteria bacterium]